MVIPVEIVQYSTASSLVSFLSSSVIPVEIVQYSTNKSFKNAKTVWDKKGGGLRAIKKLKPNTTYYIRYSITTDVSTLKGYKKIGGIWSKMIKVKTKK